MRALGPSLVLLACSLAACSANEAKPAAADAGPAAITPAPVHLAEVTGDPLKLIAPLMHRAEAPEDPVVEPAPVAAPVKAPPKRKPRARGWCAQIRAFDQRAVADEVGQGIISSTGLPVALLRADLGERGTWYRVCVGDEANRVTLKARADKWAEGPLERFLDPEREPGAPAWWPKERVASQELAAPAEPATKPLASSGAVAPSEAAPRSVPFTADQARALLGEKPDSRRPVWDVAGLEEPLGVVTRASGDAILVVDRAGAPVPVLRSAPLGCERCGTASARTLTAVGELSAQHPGEELVAIAKDGQGSAWIEVLARGAEGYSPVAGAFVGRDSTSLRTDVVVELRDGDGDGALDLSLRRRELQLADDRLCALRQEGRVYRITARGADELGSAFASAMGVAEQTGGDRAALALIATFDDLGDHDAASESCAAFLARGRSATVARTCIGRVRTLRGNGHLVAAVNAAGTLASGADALRAAVAGPFFEAAEALDADPRLTAQPVDCARQPLARRASARSMDQLIRVAQTRLQERLSLSDIATDVFVTGSRDFGPMTPVGKITDRWLERLRVTQPARRAAIDAVLAGGGQ
jgi:hypothetical protein